MANPANTPPWQNAKAEAAFAATGEFDSRWVEERCRRVVANCHPRQRAFVLDPHRRVSALVGRRGGKTTGQRARFVLKMLRVPRARCLYIATTRVAAADLMWGPLKDLLGRLGIEATFNETRLLCTLKRNGSTLKLVGASDTSEVDKIRGNKFHEVGIDEAASFPAARLENLIDRVIGPTLGDYRGTLSMFGTPGHILAGPFYDSTRPSSDRHRRYDDRELPEFASWTSWSSHSWTLLDGAPYVPAMKNAWDEALQEKADKGWSDDHPVWLREWLGQWAADSTENVFKYRPHVEGIAWNQWDPFAEHKLEGVPALAHALAQLDPVPDWHYVVGQDMGHADPYACNIFAFSPSDITKTIWHVYGVERTKMYAKLIAELLLGIELRHEKPTGLLSATGWPDGMVMDADLAVLDELQSVYGLRILKAEKKKDYKLGAIELVNGDLIEGRIKIIKGSALADQLSQLQWRTDEFGQVSENKAQANHSTDTLIYARLLIANLFESGNLETSASSRKSRDDAWKDPEDEPAEDYDGLLAPTMDIDDDE